MVEDLPVSEVEVAQHESDVHLEFVAPRTGQKRKGGEMCGVPIYARLLHKKQYTYVYFYNCRFVKLLFAESEQ